MIKKNSIYSLNKKNPDAIVYPSTTGKPVFVTREDFPNEEEFLAFKKWSDENFHSEEKLDHRESNRTVSTENISDAETAGAGRQAQNGIRYVRQAQGQADGNAVLQIVDARG